MARARYRGNSCRVGVDRRSGSSRGWHGDGDNHGAVRSDIRLCCPTSHRAGPSPSPCTSVDRPRHSPRGHEDKARNPTSDFLFVLVYAGFLLLVLVLDLVLVIHFLGLLLAVALFLFVMLVLDRSKVCHCGL